MRARDLAATLFCAALAASSRAHETWMMPSAFSATVGEEVRFDLTSGMVFPRPEGPIKVDRIATAEYRLGQDVAELKDRMTGEASLILRQAFPSAGVATVRLDLKPRDIELTDEDVDHYLDEIDATTEIREIWAGQKGKVPWKETYAKHAKTFVAVGDVKDDRSWEQSLGAALELTPTTNPFALEVGKTLTVVLHANRKPIAGLSVGVLTEGSSDRTFRTTDAEGKASFPILRPGRAMLFAVSLRLGSDRRSWQSEYCTLTFEAQALPALASIGDHEWTLAELDGQPMAPGVRAPTLTLTGGRASGFGGCNRYAGPVASNAPGRLTFGAAASTRMACADAPMALEDSFLRALSHVTSFALDDVRLVLSWQEGDRKGTLVFRR